MSDKTVERVVVELACSHNLPDPDDLLGFIESEVFKRAWKRCGLNEDDLLELQVSITCYPHFGRVIEGTGGVRKLRFSPTGSNCGKSGSHRALYCYFEEYGVVLLVTAYAKNKKDDISSSAKAAMRKMIEYQYSILAKGPIR
jgi:hypothetical protein